MISVNELWLHYTCYRLNDDFGAANVNLPAPSFFPPYVFVITSHRRSPALSFISNSPMDSPGCRSGFEIYFPGSVIRSDVLRNYQKDFACFCRVTNQITGLSR